MQAVSLSVVQSFSEVDLIGHAGEILTLNPELLSLIAANREENCLTQFSLCTIDSAPLTTLLKWKGIRVARYPGVDLVADLLNQKGKVQRILLYGAKPGVADRVASRFAHHEFLTFDGYSYDCEAVIDECRTQGFVPDVVLVALGGLLQFHVSKILAKELKPRITVACGGSFDVLCGDIPRAPQWMQRVGLEWAFRVARQPRRVGRLGGVVRGLFLARQAISVLACRKTISVSLWRG